MHGSVCFLVLTDNNSMCHFLPGLVFSHWVACLLLGYILTCHMVSIYKQQISQLAVQNLNVLHQHLAMAHAVAFVEEQRN